MVVLYRTIVLAPAEMKEDSFALVSDTEFRTTFNRYGPMYEEYFFSPLFVIS